MMTKLSVLLCLLALPVVTVADYQWQDVETGTSEWQLASDKDGVTIETRHYQGSDYKMFRASVSINASFERVLAVIEDTSHYTAWHHKMVVAEVVETTPQQTLRRTVTNLPWPVTDRESLVLSRKQQLAGGLLQIELTARPNAIAENKTFVRVPKLNGFWVIESISDKQCKVYYQLAALPGGQIPSWLANNLVTDMPYNTLSQLKQLLENE